GLLILFYLSPSAKELIDSLFSSSPVSSEKHLLILPINSIGGGADRQAFCDGLLETLSSNLSQIERFHGSLWVVPASEVIQNKIKSASEANKMFGVNLVVSGSLQFINDLLRLTLNLIDARNLRQLNSSIIDISFKDISSTQNEAVIKLLEMLNIELEPELKDILDAGKTSVPKAYEYYVQGRGKLQRYENLDNVEEAINLFRMAAKIDTNYALAFAGLGEAYWRCYEITQNLELVELAKEHAKKAFEKDSLLAHTNITLGMIYTGTGNYKLAVLHFKQVVSDNPSDAGANRGLAKAYEASGNITEAELTYKKAVKLKPDYWAGYNDLGAFYYRHSRYEEAINQFKEVIKLTPDNYRGYNNLGGIFYLLERRAEARGMFERSLQIKESYNIYSNLGTLFYVEGKFEDAAESYEQALKLNDKDYLTWGNLAAAYFWIPKKLKESLSAYKKAIDLAEDKLIINPHDPEVTSNLASYYADIGDTSKAMNLLKTSIKIAPDNVMVMYRAAAVYENLGDRDKAISWINKALQNGYSRSEIEHQPEFKNLIADQKYKQLINN
ncbi:MAG: tetratricopeptide repeat protein, partial [Ignavibacteria bacterium]